MIRRFVDARSARAHLPARSIRVNALPSRRRHPIGFEQQTSAALIHEDVNVSNEAGCELPGQFRHRQRERFGPRVGKRQLSVGVDLEPSLAFFPWVSWPIKVVVRCVWSAVLLSQSRSPGTWRYPSRSRLL